ncbi:class I adenylate-forming enzyme family protein [Scytonema sp. NUACC26]|uniref:class I adenylate-forming enzyme family protein n=1 Tax=Scytonema sp. NUACC26 TaxID=3140176 RepID=UPI0034DC61CA
MFLIQDKETLNSCKENVITDGQFILHYPDIFKIFECLQKFFPEQLISESAAVALECENSIPSIIVLLYLLEKGYSFLLLPKEVKTSQQLDSQQPIPRFCRYRLRAESLTEEGKAVSLEDPNSFLQILKNEEWIDCDRGKNYAGKKLYMRTSGSTGTPKIAVHSHANVLSNSLNCVERLSLKGDDRVAIPVPIYHMYGLGAAFLPSVAVGASIDIQKGANLLRYLQREKEFNPNIAFMTPIFCETLLKGRKSSRAYKLTVAAGDRIREDTFGKYESHFGCLVKLYGSTEMGVIAAANPEDSLEVRLQKVGLPMSGVQMRVEENQAETNDTIGELWCHHKYGFDGYVDADGMPKHENQDSQDRWFRTKDLGRIGLDGYIEVLGRCDRSVNRDGLLTIFSDVEKAIETIEGIESVVVESHGESQRGKGLIAYCVLAKGTNISEADIRASCFNILPKRAIPDYVLIVNSLPMLPNGKVDRQKLIAMTDKQEEMNLIRR